MSLNFYQGTIKTHTTLQVSQSLFDLVVKEISARNEILTQSLLKTNRSARNDVSGYLTYFEPGSPEGQTGQLGIRTFYTVNSAGRVTLLPGTTFLLINGAIIFYKCFIFLRIFGQTLTAGRPLF